ncbi:MAG TPA: hypothetical protein VFO34_18080 [Candidatus Acidoferrales bacterium]|nr:hypothetical protein [Candidatus Acidoferrales bacterium]
MSDTAKPFPTREQIDEESRQIRRLRIAATLAMQLIAAGDVPRREAEEIAAATRQLALRLFPGKEAVYDLIYGTKFRRLIESVYLVQQQLN